MARPLIAVPARFSAGASALRYRAEVAAAALVEAIFEAGGEPVVIHPAAASDDEVRGRLAFADGVLLPGGGDLSARWYGQTDHVSLYDVDEVQDAFDLAVARVTIDDGVPLLSICRGTQVVNVARGGDLIQDMPNPHRHLIHEVGGQTVSCYHHQALGRLGKDLEVTARAADGTVEAVRLPGHAGWYRGVQWHPEDTADAAPDLFEALIQAAARRPSLTAPTDARLRM
jgi:putative glutamine amidotransferase